MHVLITGARAPACLEWARAFHHVGWRVTVADSLALPLTRASRAVDSYVRLPEASRNAAKWGAALAQVIEERAVDVVLPTCEEAFFLAFEKPRLPKRCRILVTDFAEMAALHHKGLFARRTIDWPVHAPETHGIESVEQLAPFLGHPEEWVFKPAFSRFAARTMIRPNAKAVAALRPSAADPWVAQRFVPGREHCSFSVLCEGRLTAHACYHPKYRVGRGSGIYFEPTEPTGVREFVEHFGRVTGYCGQVGFDFIESSSGEIFVLECNPRATSGVHLFAGQHAALVSAVLGTQNTVLEPSKRAGAIAMAMLVFGTWRYGWRGGGFWRDLFSAHDAIMSLRDPGPAFLQLVGLFEVAGRAIARRRPLLAAATEDIEWNGGPLGGEV